MTLATHKRDRRVALISFLLLLVYCLLPTAYCLAAPPTELLPNVGFERTADGKAAGWAAFGEGYTIEASGARSGKVALRCDFRAAGEARGAVADIVLNQKIAAPVRVVGWSRAAKVSGAANADYAVYVDAELADGSALWGVSAAFATGTHEWRRAQVIVQAAQPIKSLKVYALFRGHSGTIWFDDFSAQELKGPDVFDSQILAAPKLPANQKSGWFIRDVAANGPLKELKLDKESGEYRLIKFFTVAGGITETQTVGIRNAPKDAVTLYYVERFDAAKPVWWRDIQRAEAAGDSDRSETERMATVGATGTHARYPIACVTGEGKGRFLAVPPTLTPRIFRLGYHPASHLLYVAFDLSLRGERQGVTTISITPGDCDPTWGLRDAWLKYTALYSVFYARRATAEGIWLPFTDPATIKDAADFGFAYHEGDNSVATDDKAHILSFRYTEPMTFWMNLPKDAPREYTPSVEYLKRLAAGQEKGDAATVTAAQAALNSPTEDENGVRNHDFRKEPWADGVVWILNPAHDEGGKMTQSRRNFDDADADKRFKRGAYPPYNGGALDGEYLDSLEAWAEIRDFRPESLVNISKTFASDSYRPCIPEWFHVWRFTRVMRSEMGLRKKLLFANSTPWNLCTLMPLVDVAGTETNWLEGDRFRPESDDIMARRRMLSGKKPYLLLMNTDYNKFDSKMVEAYFQRCLFWGIYPSFFSHNAAENPYWENPKWYERDRPLFKKYLPTIKRLSAAGWEPVTNAHSDNPKIRIERYGNTLFTVHADSSASEKAQVTIDLTYLDPANYTHITDTLIVTDLISGRTIARTGVSGIMRYASARFSVAVAPNETLALSIAFQPKKPNRTGLPFPVPIPASSR